MSKRKHLLVGYEDCPNRYVRGVFNQILKYTSQVSISIRGARFYKDFNSFTVTGDGMPMARFVFSQDFKQAMFVFASNWGGNNELSHAANPDSIPYVFPVKELKKHLLKIKI